MTHFRATVASGRARAALLLAALCATLASSVHASPDPLSVDITEFNNVSPAADVSVVRGTVTGGTAVWSGSGSGTYAVAWRGVMPEWLYAVPEGQWAKGGQLTINPTTATTGSWSGAFVANTEFKVRIWDAVDNSNKTPWETVTVTVTPRDWLLDPLPAAEESTTWGDTPVTVNTPLGYLDLEADYSGVSAGWVNDGGPNSDIRYAKLYGDVAAYYAIHHDLVNPQGPFRLAQLQPGETGAPGPCWIYDFDLERETRRHEYDYPMPVAGFSHYTNMSWLLSDGDKNPATAAESITSFFYGGVHYLSNGQTTSGSGSFKAYVIAKMDERWGGTWNQWVTMPEPPSGQETPTGEFLGNIQYDY